MTFPVISEQCLVSNRIFILGADISRAFRDLVFFRNALDVLD